MVCGDMNIAPTDADVFDPAAYVGHTHVTAPERAALAELYLDVNAPGGEAEQRRGLVAGADGAGAAAAADAGGDEAKS